MSISTELTTLNNNLLSAYSKISEKGGTVPANKNTANLASAIGSISQGSTRESWDDSFTLDNATNTISIQVDDKFNSSESHVFIFSESDYRVVENTFLAGWLMLSPPTTLFFNALYRQSNSSITTGLVQGSYAYDATNHVITMTLDVRSLSPGIIKFNAGWRYDWSLFRYNHS